MTAVFKLVSLISLELFFAWVAEVRLQEVDYSTVWTLAIIVAQFLLGVGLGYLIVRALKYFLAAFVLLILGFLLGFWA